MKCSTKKLCVWEAGLVLCGSLCGCAVLTVDVDVYKGALVNEEHVQLHQLVALTTAAQPMLVHLRDNLEWPDTDGKPPKGATTYPDNDSGKCEGKQWKGSWYETGHIKTPEDWVAESPKPWWRAFGETLQEWFTGPLCRPHFKNPYARAVNNVLSLYDDHADSDLAPHARKLRQAVEQLRRATSNPEEDRASYVELASQLIADTDLAPELRNLKQGYQELLASSSGSEPSRKVGKLMDALKELRDKPEAITKQKSEKKHNQLEADLLSKWERTKVYRDRDEIYDRRLPFRAVWKFLGEGLADTFLAQVTQELCQKSSTGGSACDALLKRTKELADEYWKSRKAVRDIWLESLGLLAEIERLRRADSKVYDDLKSKVIRLIVEVTNVRHIASALDRLDHDAQCSLLRNPLSPGLFCKVGKDSQPIWSESNVRNHVGYYEEVLRRNLSSSPADTAHFLLYLDSLESTAPQKNSVGNALVEAANKVNPQRLVRLGLNRSFIEDRKLEGSPELFDFVDDVSRKVAQGFERGRLPDGLHTLTEAFLKSHDGNTDTGDSHDEKKLLDALVEFAQKLLFLANHEGLSSPPGTSGLILGGAEKINRGLFGDSLTDAGLYGLFGSGLAERRKQQYVRVLQAVGNSILFSANELRERDRYREQGLKRVAAEVAAARSVYSSDPEKVITDLLTELEHDKQAAQTALDAAKVRKKKIEEDIGSSTAPKTGLNAKQDSAVGEVTQADASLRDYRNSLDTLKAIHDVLTGDVIQQVKSKWGPSPPDATTEGDFLISGDFSLEATLRTVQKKNSDWDDVLRYLASSETKQDFIAYRTLEKKSSLKRLDLFDDFVAQIRWLVAKRVTRNEKQAGLDDVTQKIDTLQKEVSALETQINNSLPQDKADFETAKTRIEAVKAAVLKEIDQGRPFAPSNKEVYARISVHLQKTNTTDYQTAQRILASRMPPPDMSPLDRKDFKNPIDVMDQVIALLRHRQMEAVERFGKDSEQDKKATEALENAYQHRAGMIYLRPSSAYLRTSFPSTSLQDDPNLAWDNMLLKQGIRNLPFSSQLRDILDPSVERDRILTAELDKQYWQNINRVRVSGVGFTNQALVKDDVGNWYVKQYYGDTKDIVKSAKHLALFALGTKLPIDLSHELTKVALTKDDSKKSDAEKEAELPPLQQVFLKHRAAYHTHTVELSGRLVELHGKDGEKSLHHQVRTGWERDGELKKDTDLKQAITSALGEEVAQWDKTLEPLKNASDRDRGHAITKDLQALAKLEKLLSARIRRSRNEEPAKSRAAKAADEVHKVVADVLIPLLEDHKQALDRYEQAVLFIGDAANPKDPKQEQGK